MRAGILNVDRISDVTWNKTAFAQLVAPDETKELIQAVVTAHGQRSSIAPDIIEGKGQGLLILLHGGPGTGKTLTAESIAEEQERPLYRVTCGDIGTEPRDVERVGQRALHLVRTIRVDTDSTWAMSSRSVRPGGAVCDTIDILT